MLTYIGNFISRIPLKLPILIEMTVSINDYCYGTQEFGEILQSIAEENNFTPIENMMEWSRIEWSGCNVSME